MPNGEYVIRASEIGEYVFCQRAWWFHRVRGVESANHAQMQAGAARHLAHGRTIQRADLMRRIAIVLFVIAFFLALLYGLVFVLPVL